MTLINMLRPKHRQWLRRLRKRLANREHMRRAREARKLCCVGVDLPLDAGTCGRMVHAESQRCIHCARRRCVAAQARPERRRGRDHRHRRRRHVVARDPRRHARRPPGHRSEPRRPLRLGRPLFALVELCGLVGPDLPRARHCAPLPQPASPDLRLIATTPKRTVVKKKRANRIPSRSVSDRGSLYLRAPPPGVRDGRSEMRFLLAQTGACGP